MTLLNTLVITSFLALLLSHSTTSSSSSSPSSPSNYNVYNYDLTTPLFTPDGRIMQVEYASSAPTHSFPLVALPFYLPQGKNYGVVMATVITGGSSYDTSAPTLSNGGTGASIMGRTKTSRGGSGGSSSSSSRRSRGQSRIVELPIGPPPPSSSSSRTGAVINSAAGGASFHSHLDSPHHHHQKTVVVGLSGILSDSVSLLNEARTHLTSFHRSYGMHRPLPLLHHHSQIRRRGGRGDETTHLSSSASNAAKRIAHSIGDACQSHAFGGGLRPYGSTLIVCGVDDEKVSICVTSPSGAVSVRTIDVNDDDYDDEFSHDHATGASEAPSPSAGRFILPEPIIVGGDRMSQRRVRGTVEQSIRDYYSKEDGKKKEDHVIVLGDELADDRGAIRNAVESTIKSLLEEYKKRKPIEQKRIIYNEEEENDEEAQISSSESASSSTSSSNIENVRGESNSEMTRIPHINSSPSLEIVVITPRQGANRLMDHQIDALVRRLSFDGCANTNE